MFISWSGSVGAITALVSSFVRRAQPAEVCPRGSRIGRESLVHWLESVATMLEAGVPLPAILESLANNSPLAASRALSQAMLHSLHGGLSLSRAAAQHPSTFSALHVTLLRLGEASRSLVAVVRQLAAFERRLLGTGERIRTSVTYPLMLFAGCTAGLALAPPLLLEPHFQLIRDLQVEIPALTRVLMEFSACMLTPWLYLVVAVAAVGLAKLAAALAENRSAVHFGTRALLRTPKVARVLRALLAIRFARGLLVQLQCGVAAPDAVDVLARAAGNPVLQEEAENVWDRTLRGDDFGTALRGSTLFSALFTRSAVLRYAHDPRELADVLAETAECDLDTSLDDLTGFVEPAIVAAIGLIVFTMVLATMSPLSAALDAL